MSRTKQGITSTRMLLSIPKSRQKCSISWRLVGGIYARREQYGQGAKDLSRPAPGGGEYVLLHRGSVQALGSGPAAQSAVR